MDLKVFKLAANTKNHKLLKDYDYVLINNDLDKTENDLKTIIKAERLKLSQQPRIVDDVRNLNNEFENR